MTPTTRKLPPRGRATPLKKRKATQTKPPSPRAKPLTTPARLEPRRTARPHLPGVLAARAAARERAWAAGASPDLTGLLDIDFDATVTISHSEDKENAAKTWKRTYGFHPLLAFLDRPDVSGGEVPNAHVEALPYFVSQPSCRGGDHRRVQGTSRRPVCSGTAWWRFVWFAAPLAVLGKWTAVDATLGGGAVV
ncbi:hypothetical protein QMK34_07895 [Amycolatopsis sp. H20-H5]|nr:hypothetical protein [Amycolatopsis sp. H20-H5]MEC3975203.1 hypothetical protein [Amycolatopsis sp. H20-H5]